MKNMMKNLAILLSLLLTLWLISGCVYIIPETATLATPMQTTTSTVNACQPLTEWQTVQIGLDFTDAAQANLLIKPTIRVFSNQIDGERNELPRASAAAHPAESGYFDCNDLSCQIIDQGLTGTTTGYTIEMQQAGYLTTTTTIGIATRDGCPLAQGLNVVIEPRCSADRPIGILPMRLLDDKGLPVENAVVTYRTAAEDAPQEATCVQMGYDGGYFCEIAVTGPLTSTATISAQIGGDRVKPLQHDFSLNINANHCLYQPADWREELTLADACGVTPPRSLRLFDMAGNPYAQPVEVSISGHSSSLSSEELTTTCADRKAGNACAHYQLNIPHAGDYTVFVRRPDGVHLATRSISIPGQANGCIADTDSDAYTMFIADADERPSAATLTNDPAICQVDPQELPATLRLFLPPDQADLPVTLAYQIGAAPSTPATACTTHGQVAQCDLTVPYPITENVTAQIRVGAEETQTATLANFDWFQCTEDGAVEIVQEHSFSIGSFSGGMTLMGGGCDNMCYNVPDATHLFFELYLDQQ